MLGKKYENSIFVNDCLRDRLLIFMRLVAPLTPWVAGPRVWSCENSNFVIIAPIDVFEMVFLIVFQCWERIWWWLEQLLWAYKI